MTQPPSEPGEEPQKSGNQPSGSDQSGNEPAAPQPGPEQQPPAADQPLSNPPSAERPHQGPEAGNPYQQGPGGQFAPPPPPYGQQPPPYNAPQGYPPPPPPYGAQPPGQAGQPFGQPGQSNQPYGPPPGAGYPGYGMQYPSQPPTAKPNRTPIIAIGVVVVLALLGVGTWLLFFRGPDTSTPRAVVKEFLKAAQDNDVEKGKSLVCKQIKDSASRIGPVVGRDGGLDSFTIEDENRKDSANATVTTKLKLSGNPGLTTIVWRVIKEDGEYRVCGTANSIQLDELNTPGSASFPTSGNVPTVPPGGVSTNPNFPGSDSLPGSGSLPTGSDSLPGSGSFPTGSGSSPTGPAFPPGG